jgi:hypothetical protein
MRFAAAPRNRAARGRTFDVDLHLELDIYVGRSFRKEKILDAISTGTAYDLEIVRRGPDGAALG